MKLLVAGSRNIESFDLEPYIPNGINMIISGGAKGIDKIAEDYADKMNMPKTIIYPKYEVYGRFAPLKRNEEMVELCDVALIIWDGHSKGTKYTIDYANKMGKQVILVMEK